MNIIQANISAIKNIIRPWGRATRSEFWWVMAVLFGSLMIVIFVDLLFSKYIGYDSFLYIILNLAFIIVVFSWAGLGLLVTIRRLHDMELSGWFALLYLLSGIGMLIMAVLCSQPGTFGPNKYGLDPLYDETKNVGKIFE